jgi:hypothetical protein
VGKSKQDGGKPEASVNSEQRSVGLGAQLSAFLAWVKPYKEIVTLAFAVFAVISGLISWVVAHFATQAELSYLECRINNNIETQALEDKTNAFAIAVQLRNSQIKQLTDQPPSNGSNVSIGRLSEEVSSITREQFSYSVEAKKKIDENAKRCIQDALSRTAPQKMKVLVMNIMSNTVIIAALFLIAAAHAQQPPGEGPCPSPDILDCTPKQECGQPKNTRDCNVCLLRNPFGGGCSIRGNDPACEAAKASENGLYEAQKIQCEAQKSAQKLSCETTKAALQAAAERCLANRSTPR